MSGKKTRIVASPEALTHNPFGALLPADASPSMEISEPAPTPKNEATPSIARFSFEGKAANAKVVIARERKGRAGKTVTLVSIAGASVTQLDELCTQMRTALGCGGAREELSIAIAGDQAARVETWLRNRGAQKIVRADK